MKKVGIIVHTDSYIEDEVWDGILLQDYPNTLVIASQMKSQFKHTDPSIHKYINCAQHRNHAAKMALATDAEYFLFVDSDTVPPPHAVSTLMASGKDIIGGWYPMVNCERWVAGYQHKDLFFNYRKVEPGITQVNLMGLGCALIHRDVVSKIPFRSGIDIPCEIAYVGKGIAGECAAFTADAEKAGHKVYMHGDVVCRHLTRRPRTPRTLPTISWDFEKKGMNYAVRN